MIKNAVRGIISTLCRPVTTLLDPIVERIDGLYDLILTEANSHIAANSENPLNRFGRKIFSQTNEDGITIEILRRLGLEKGSFAEFGVGNGLENNTLVLAALGWTGFWVGNQELAFSPQPGSNIRFHKQWITLDNIAETAKQACSQLGAEKLDVISLDLDGNDYYLVERLLRSGFLPSLFIVEYNAKFPPPIRFKIIYDQNHSWNGDDYFGASLATYNELFERFLYQLVCCNSDTGSNAFYVRREYMGSFGDVPKSVGQIYAPPRYYLYREYGHKKSGKTVEAILKQNSVSAAQDTVQETVQQTVPEKMQKIS
jgi:hypothetical protein